MSLIEKFKRGIRTDLKGTLLRSSRFILRRMGAVAEHVLYLVFWIPLRLLPARTLAKLKHSMSPVVRLDYNRRVIHLHADSDLNVRRAGACEKEPETVKWIEEFISPGEVLFDVGANVGAYSLVACKYFHDQVLVHSFEPSFSNYYQLCRNVILNGCQGSVIPHMIALTDKTGPVAFNYSSLDQGSADHYLGNDVEAAPRQFQPVYRQQLLGFRLDDLVSKFGFPVPNHIKLDVDGTEYAVLLGAANTLNDRSVKSVLVEIQDLKGAADRIAGFLAGKGFVVASKTDRGGGMVWNYIFRREE